MREVRSEITGTVIALSVKVGDVVASGTELVVLESMKMEIPVTSPVGGVVRTIEVSVGDTVLESAVIAVIEPG